MNRNAMALLPLLGTMAWSFDARATPDFPVAVEQYLNLPSGVIVSKIDPPCGCPLCHVNGCGGGPPLTDFGTLMQANGAVPFLAAQTAGPALAAIGSMEPQLIADLQSARDPNLDPSLTSTSTVHYGCGVASGTSDGPGAMWLWIAGAACLARRRRTSNLAL
jgi:MYXO-CTERM domain-containing protein